MPRTQKKLPFLVEIAGGLILAIVIVAAVPLQSIVMRFSNLDLENSSIPDTYLMHSKSNPAKAYVVNRRNSTMRRSDQNQPGRMWEVFELEVDSSTSTGSTYLVKSKRIGKGTVFFVPVEQVRDWVYPFLYEFARAQDQSLNLPPIEWTNFYVDRIYKGLYLRVALPFDLRKKDNGSDILRELLFVTSAGLNYVDTRFDDSPGVYAETVEMGAFPPLVEPTPMLIWLAHRCPTDTTTFLLSNVLPYSVSVLPLPIDLPVLFRAKNSRSLSGYEDARVNQWMTWKDIEPEQVPFSSAQLEQMREEFVLYSQNFMAALARHGEFNRNKAMLFELLDDRSTSGRSVMLNFRNE